MVGEGGEQKGAVREENGTLRSLRGVMSFTNILKFFNEMIRFQSLWKKLLASVHYYKPILFTDSQKKKL